MLTPFRTDDEQRQIKLIEHPEQNIMSTFGLADRLTDEDGLWAEENVTRTDLDDLLRHCMLELIDSTTQER